MRKTLLSSLIHGPLTEALQAGDNETEALAEQLNTTARKKLGRSLSIRLVDAGSCNACELEINALNNAFYDLERFGLRFVASPRHADVLMVTGPVTKNMQEALERTYQAMPAPKWVVAVGDASPKMDRRSRRLCNRLRPAQFGLRLARGRCFGAAG